MESLGEWTRTWPRSLSRFQQRATSPARCACSASSFPARHNVEQIQADWSGDGHTLILSLAYGGTRPPASTGYAYSTASGRVSRILRDWFWSAPVFAGPHGHVLFGRMKGRAFILALESGGSPADAKARSSERFRLAVEAFVAALVDLPPPASTGSHAFS